MSAPVPRKDNYAACVKEIMPFGSGPAGPEIVHIAIWYDYCGNKPNTNERAGLTARVYSSIIIFAHTSHAQEAETRSQGSCSAATGLLGPPSRTGHRRTVSDSRVLRSPRPGSGEVRNAAPGANRRNASQPISSRLRVLTALLLPSAGYFPTGRPAGADAPEARAQASSQTHWRGARLPSAGASGRSLFTPGAAGFAPPGSLWQHGSATHH